MIDKKFQKYDYFFYTFQKYILFEKNIKLMIFQFFFYSFDVHKNKYQYEKNYFNIFSSKNYF